MCRNQKSGSGDNQHRVQVRNLSKQKKRNQRKIYQWPEESYRQIKFTNSCSTCRMKTGNWSKKKIEEEEENRNCDETVQHSSICVAQNMKCTFAREISYYTLFGIQVDWITTHKPI